MRSLSVSTKLEYIATLAKQSPDWVLTTLSHHIDVDFLYEAYRRTRKDGALGVDGESAEDFARDLEINLAELLAQLKTGNFRAPPVRRVYIPKGSGKGQRPLGIPTFADKVMQRAVTMVLEAVYEQDFLDCSYGFRPGRSAHQALDRIWKGIMKMQGGWVLEVDIKGYFDAIDHKQLRGFLDQRVRDGVVRRAVDKWLKAGVLEKGQIRYPETGSPQGGVISPLLANIYLHEVADKWFEHVVKPKLTGQAFLVRYADDLIMVFSQESDAHKVMEVLPKRFGRYGLELNKEKTRLLQFKPPKDKEGPKPDSFDFLGFNHHWGLSRNGRWVVKRKTAKDRFSRSLIRIAKWMKIHRHFTMCWQHRMLCMKLKGHYGYYGITGNSQALSRFRHEVTRLWHKWLNRRSQRATMPWDRFRKLLEFYTLPPSVCAHSVLRSVAKP